MKKILSITFFVFASSIVLAQDYKFETGIQGGAGITDIAYNNSLFNNSYKPRLGYTGSLFLQYNFNKYFSLRADPGVDRKGAKNVMEIPDPFGNASAKSNIVGKTSYMTIPILFRAGIGNKIRGFVNAGPYAGFFLYAKDVLKLPGENFTFTDKAGSGGHKIDFGITSGVGFLVPVKEQLYISFELRENMGLVNMNKKLPAPYQNYSTKNFSANLLIGIAYRFGSKK